MWITPKSGERGTGNGEPETRGHPCPTGQRREQGTGNRERGDGNLGTPVAVNKGGNRSYECGLPRHRPWPCQGVQRAECRIRFFKSGTEARGTGGGTRDPPQAGRPRARKLPKRQSAADGREPGLGNRKPGTGNKGTGNRERGTGNGEPGTGNGEQGTGNRERGTGNGEQGTAKGKQTRSHGTWNPPQAGRLWNLKLGTAVLT